MNAKFIKYNLQEIQEELEELIKKLDRGLPNAELYTAIQHIYHHLNIAWNARDTVTGDTYEQDDPKMQIWKEFPTDIKLI